MATTIKTKIFLTVFSISLVFVFIAILIMNRFIGQIADNEITHNLNSAKSAFERFDRLQADLLISRARSIAQAPHLKAVMNIPHVDHETVYYTARNLFETGEMNLMLLIDANGTLLADLSDQTYYGQDMRLLPVIKEGLTGNEIHGIYQYREQLYNIALTPVTMDRQLLGLLVIGEQITEKSMQEIREFSGSDVLLFFANELVSQSKIGRETKSISQEEISALSDRLNEFNRENYEPLIFPAILKKEKCLAIAIPLQHKSGYTVLYRSLDDIESSVTVLRISLLGAGVASIILAVFFSFWLSSAISKPILDLRDAAEQFGAGHLEARVNILSKDELGQLSAAFNKMAQDIQTVRHDLESERDHTKNILNSMIDMVIVLSNAGTIRALNPATIATLGYTEAELAGKPLKDIVRIAKKDQEMESFEDMWDILLKNRYIRNVEGEFDTKDGKKIPVILSGSVLQDEHSNNQGIVFVAQDITEQKQAQEAIRKLSLAVEQSPSVVMITNIDGAIEYVNPKFETVTGYSSKEVIGNNPRILKSNKHPRKFYKEMWNTLLSGKEWQGEFVNKKKNGDMYWVSTSISPIRNEENNITHFIGIQEDITKRKQAEKLLRNSQKQLQALSTHIQRMQEEERTRISREIHDELGQSLTGIKMDLVWLKDEMSLRHKPLIDKLIKFIDSTMNTVQRISTQLRPVILDDLGLIAAIEWQIQDFQSRSGINCELSFETEEISIDQDRSTAIFRILQEALTNILRHADANKVIVNLEQKGKNLLMSVIDDGIGISKEQITNRNSLGILGMKERLQPWGGEFQINKMNGSGTKLTVRLPLAK